MLAIRDHSGLSLRRGGCPLWVDGGRPPRRTAIVSKGRRLCENSVSDSVAPRRATVVAIFSHSARPQASKIRDAPDPLTVFAQPRSFLPIRQAVGERR